MTRSTLPALAAAVTLLAGLAAGAVLFRNRGIPAGLTAQLDSLAARLAAIEGRAAARANRDPAPAPERAAAAPELEPGEVDPESDSDDDGQPAGDLAARVEDLERRLQALETDPIERGYAYLQSQNAELRRRGIRALEAVAAGDPQAREALLRMLGDPEAAVRLETLDALADLEDKALAGEITNLLADPSAEVREEAIDTLAELGAEGEATAIAGLLGDPESQVREEAANALGELKNSAAAPALIAALQDTSEDVRGEAIASLGEIGARDAVPLLRALFDKDPGIHRLRLIRALQQLGDSQPLQMEIERLSQAALNASADTARSEAVRNLAQLAPGQAEEVLRKALEDPSSRVRREAERAMERRRRNQREER
jgi:HEAT repeat protein